MNIMSPNNEKSLPPLLSLLVEGMIRLYVERFPKDILPYHGIHTKISTKFFVPGPP